MTSMPKLLCETLSGPHCKSGRGPFWWSGELLIQFERVDSFPWSPSQPSPEPETSLPDPSSKQKPEQLLQQGSPCSATQEMDSLFCQAPQARQSQPLRSSWEKLLDLKLDIIQAGIVQGSSQAPYGQTECLSCSVCIRKSVSSIDQDIQSPQKRNIKKRIFQGQKKYTEAKVQALHVYQANSSIKCLPFSSHHNLVKLGNHPHFSGNKA